MKKLLQRLFTALAALSIIFTSLGAVSTVFAQENAPKDTDTYDIVLTKIKLKDLSGWPKTTGQNGTEYTGQALNSLTDYFGAGAETLDGVWFEVHKYDETKQDHIGELAEGTKVSGLTENGGKITFQGLKAGKYIIVEKKDKSTLASQEQLAEAAAVPMEINLPVFKATGGWYTTGNDALHVYPKNTVDKPTINKVVNENDKHDSADLGQKKTFKVTSNMPKGIADYKVLNFEDKFSKGLSYAGNLKVMKNNQEIPAENYTATQPNVGTKGATVKVAFKEDYIKTLKPNDVITLTYDATINEDAVMGAENPNNIAVEYGTNPTVTKKENPTETPELHTGGAKFIKKDKATAAALKDAEFVVKNTNSKYMKKEGNVVTWVDDKAQATTIKSQADGTFEVTGLAFGEKNKKPSEAGTTTYYLEETKAPQGYALLQQPIEFKVGYNTYYKDPTVTNPVSTDPQVVNNNKVTIPQTGGIGSVVVIAAGILIVGLGLFAKRRATEKD